jgi:uncharacterized protein YecT (DUF1311 family)
MLDSRCRPPSGPVGSPGMTAGFESAVLMEGGAVEGALPIASAVRRPTWTGPPMKHLLLIVVVVVMAWSRCRAEDAAPPNCDIGGASASAECLNRASRNEDKRLNAVYNLIMRMLDAGAADPAIGFFYDKKKNLVAAQRAWVKYREAQCAAEATILGPVSASGTVQVTGECFLQMTQNRIAYLEGVVSSLSPESNLCQKSADPCRLK